MNIKEYPLVEFRGMKLRRVPEVDDFDLKGMHGGMMSERCMFCVAVQHNSKALCMDLRDWAERMPEQLSCSDSSGKAGVYLQETDEQDYVVELVRRRVSS